MQIPPCHSSEQEFFLCWAPCGLHLLEAVGGGCYLMLFPISTRAVVLGHRGLGCCGVFIGQFQFETLCFYPLFRKSLSSCISSSYWYILFCVYRDVSYI